MDIHSRYRVIFAAGAFFLLVIAWSVTIAFHGAPDESTHYYLLDYLYTTHHLPVSTTIDQPFHGKLTGHTWQPGDFWYHGLPFPHVLGGLTTSYLLASLLPPDLGFLAARAFNWGLAPIFFISICQIAESVCARRLTAMIIATAVCLIPQVTFIFSYFNSDAYGITAVAITLAACLRFLTKPNLGRAFLLGLSIALLLLAKLYFLPAIVFIAVRVVADCVVGRRYSPRKLAIICVTAFIAAAPMLIMTYMSWGEITGVSGQAAFVEMHRNDPGSLAGTCYVGCPGAVVNVETLAPWLNLSLKSYFSVTGWMNVFIPSFNYTIAALLFAVLIGMAIVMAITRLSGQPRSAYVLDDVLPTVMAIGIFPAILLFSILGSQLSMPQPQGRYLFVTIPFIAFLAAYGAGKPVDRRVGMSAGSYLATGILIWLAVANATAMGRTLQASTALAKTPLVMALDAGTHGALSSAFGADVAGAIAAPGRVVHDADGLKFKMAPGPGAQGHIDEITPEPAAFTVRGWAYVSGKRSLAVVAVDGGGRTTFGTIGSQRSDVATALGTRAAERSGFMIQLSPANGSACSNSFFVINSDLSVSRIPSDCAANTMDVNKL